MKQITKPTPPQVTCMIRKCAPFGPMLALYSITSPNASKAATQKTRMVVATFNS